MNTVEQNNVQSSDLVVVGSSAGGIEALSILVSTLPDVYLTEDRLKRPRPSVDTLLSTAAEAYGDHLIAVILTGSGSDGAAGAVDVKNAGGTVIVQDPQTARFPSMPLALPPTVIDFEVNIERIGPLLYDLFNGVNILPAEERTEDVLHDILEQVSRLVAFPLNPHGFLFLGKAETVRPTQLFYELENKHWKIYRCIGRYCCRAKIPCSTGRLRWRGELRSIFRNSLCPFRTSLRQSGIIISPLLSIRSWIVCATCSFPL